MTKEGRGGRIGVGGFGVGVRRWGQEVGIGGVGLGSEEMGLGSGG